MPRSYAVDGDGRWTRSNTNLGIILLLAPLARAARGKGRASGTSCGRAGGDHRGRRRGDYAAIRRARPGGLGSSSSEDVAPAPTVTLRDAMALAADRDSVAREYATDFGTTFEIGAPALRAARSSGLDWSAATVETYLRLLATVPDTHIARKLGRAAADAVSHRAREIEQLGGARTAEGRRALEAFDGELRSPTNAHNPGTTADLTCAALFVVILEGKRTR